MTLTELVQYRKLVNTAIRRNLKPIEKLTLDRLSNLHGMKNKPSYHWDISKLKQIRNGQTK